MVGVEDSDLLSIPEAAKALKVSVATVKRWISDGRLPAFRLGPRKMRIRQLDLEKVFTPVGVKEAAMPYSSTQRDQAWIDTHIKPYTPVELEQMRRAMDDLDALQAEMLAERGGKPFPDSSHLIRRARRDGSLAR